MDLKEVINNLPNQLHQGAKSAEGFNYDQSPSKIIISAMGGSLIAGKILKLLSPQIILNEFYDLSTHIENDFLSICISWSGKTEETISAYIESKKRGLETLVITGGNRLEELAKADNTPLIILPKDSIQPRYAVGYMVGALLKAIGLEKELDISLDSAIREDQGHELADQIESKIPLLYATTQWPYLPDFWKTLFNESCKIHADTNIFPSLDHNEVASFKKEDSAKYIPIIFQDEHEDPREMIDIKAAIAILKELGYNYLNVKISGKTPLEKVFNNYILGLWTTFYLAQKLGVDPQDIEVIEHFKKLKVALNN